MTTIQRYYRVVARQRGLRHPRSAGAAGTNPPGQRRVGCTFDEQRAADLEIAELLDLVTRAFAEPIIEPACATTLRNWLANRPLLSRTNPAGARIAARLGCILAAGTVDEDERASLLAIRAHIATEPDLIDRAMHDVVAGSIDGSTHNLRFDCRQFAAVGEFAYGSRGRVGRMLISRGAIWDENITPHTNVLVVGRFTNACAHEELHKAIRTFGRRLEIVGELQCFELMAAA